jgi:adenine-specific DNA-methyltransferase
MSAIQSLLNQIHDLNLRKRLLQEFNRLKKNKKLGIVFEEHIPECTLLYNIPIKCGYNVVNKSEHFNDIFIVKTIHGKEI